MSRKHVAVIAVLLAVAAAAALLGLTSTLRARAPSSTVSAVSIQRRTRALDRLELQLRRELHQRPPALPAATTAAPAPVAAAPEVVTVRRQPTIVRLASRHESEHEAEPGEDADD